MPNAGKVSPKSQICGFRLGTSSTLNLIFSLRYPIREGSLVWQGINLSWKILNLRILSLQPTQAGKLLNYLFRKLLSSSHPTFRIFLGSTSIIAVAFSLSSSRCCLKKLQSADGNHPVLPLPGTKLAWLVGWLAWLVGWLGWLVGLVGWLIGVGIFVGVTTGRTRRKGHHFSQAVCKDLLTFKAFIEKSTFLGLIFCSLHSILPSEDGVFRLKVWCCWWDLV